MKYCLQGTVHAHDCAATPNKHCVAIAGPDKVTCLVSQDTTTCALGSPLTPCVTAQGKAWALGCMQSSVDPQEKQTYYGPCATGYCMPDTSVPGAGKCSGAPCTGDYRKCVGDELHVCEQGNGLSVYDCAKKGQACYESSLNNGWAACHNKNESPCDPVTFQPTCTSATEGVSCSPGLGYTNHFDCASIGQSCCFNTDAGFNPSNSCC